MVNGVQKNRAGMFYGVLASLIWGSWPVMSSIASAHALSPVDIASLRFTIAGVILLPVLVYQSVKLRLIVTKGIILAIGAGAPYVLLAMYGLNLSSSAHFGAIAPSTMLVFSSIGSVFLFKDKISPIRCAGIMFIIIGVIAIGALNVGSINSSVMIGDLMFIGCGALWASFTLLSKYWQLNSWVATAMVSVISGLLCAPFALDVVQNNPIDLLLYHGVYQGVLVAIVALYCYSKSVTILGSARGAIFASLVPPISLVLSYLILGEQMTRVEIVGSLSICLGMILALGLIKLNRLSLLVAQK